MCKAATIGLRMLPQYSRKTVKDFRESHLLSDETVFRKSSKQRKQQGILACLCMGGGGDFTLVQLLYEGCEEHSGEETVQQMEDRWEYQTQKPILSNCP